MSGAETGAQIGGELGSTWDVMILRWQWLWNAVFSWGWGVDLGEVGDTHNLQRRPGSRNRLNLGRRVWTV